ncbi:MAG: addiction module toxin, HicA family [Methylomarinum sp.]|nr:addiction module toxin, HicA family [Methylomarinum sp.]
MSKLSKIKEKLKCEPIAKDFTWDELSCLLLALGYIKKEGSGSRVKFFHKETNHPILLHKPHPGNEIKPTALKSIRDELKKIGAL